MKLFNRKSEKEEVPAAKQSIMMYTEQTPNPETLKFVTNKMLFAGTAEFKNEEVAKEWSLLSASLMEFPFVKQTYISNNFVTVTKEINYSWQDIMLELKDFIKNHIEAGKEVVKEGFMEAMAAKEKETGVGYQYEGDEAGIVKKIVEIIDTYIKPGVQQDGGNIAFLGYNDGIVEVELQGSCSGCPSATYTLKNGIENMLTKMVPEVKEVVAQMQ